jgi:hypothetical protein
MVLQFELQTDEPRQGTKSAKARVICGSCASLRLFVPSTIPRTGQYPGREVRSGSLPGRVRPCADAGEGCEDVTDRDIPADFRRCPSEITHCGSKAGAWGTALPPLRVHRTRRPHGRERCEQPPSRQDEPLAAPMNRCIPTLAATPWAERVASAPASWTAVASGARHRFGRGLNHPLAGPAKAPSSLRSAGAVQDAPARLAANSPEPRTDNLGMHCQ